MQCLRSWDKPSDTTLYADFIVQSYYITYMGLDGGANPPDNPTTYNIESPTIKLEPPTKVGYTGSWDISVIPHGSTGNIVISVSWDLEELLSSKHQWQRYRIDGRQRRQRRQWRERG